MILIDTNVVLDVLLNDEEWGERSYNFLLFQLQTNELAINPIIYGELAAGYETIEALENAVKLFKKLPLPYEAAFLAEKAFMKYKKQSGLKTRPLADFFIGAHALILGSPLITRDSEKYKTYFPSLKLISP